MAWPTTADLSRLLGGAGMTPPATQDLAEALDAAVEEFENRTGYQPFIAAGVDSTRTFDGPNGNTLDLGGGLVAPPTTLTVLGQTYALGSSYFLYPQNAPALGLPYTQVRFGAKALYDYEWEGIHGNYLGDGLALVTITGRWGWGTDAPALARRGVLGRAAALLVPQVVAAISGGRRQFTANSGDSETYSDRPHLATLEGWQDAFDRAVRQYRRVTGFRSLKIAAGVVA